MTGSHLLTDLLFLLMFTGHNYQSRKMVLAMQSTVTSWLLLKQLCQSAMAKQMLNEDFL